MSETASFLDSHCHLQKLQMTTEGLAHVSTPTAVAGESRTFCNATREEDWQAVLDLAARTNKVIPFLGIHPWFASDVTANWEKRLFSLLDQSPAGIGETGLDRCCRTDPGKQEQIFLAQLLMASELQRPLVIHCVKAWGRLLEILKRFAGPLPPIMFHSFSGSSETMRQLIRLGGFISYSCRLATSSKLHPCFLETPMAHLLLETDSSGPADITNLYRFAADLRGMAINEFRQEIWNNGEIFAHTILSR